jgi:hypothetical protein
MIVEVTFKSGEVWEVKTLYLAEYKHYACSDEAYYILPQSDILISRVSVEEFARSQQEAKHGAPIGDSDIGQVLGCSRQVKKCEKKWTEVKPKGPVWTEVCDKAA